MYFWRSDSGEMCEHRKLGTVVQNSAKQDRQNVNFLCLVLEIQKKPEQLN